MSTRPTVGSPARGAMKRTVSFPNTDRAEAGYGSVPGTGDDEPSTSSGWTTMPLVAGRLLLTIAVFGVLGSLLPFFAVWWANKLGNAPGFVKKTGGSVSGLQMLQSMPVVSLGQAPGDANLLGTQLKPCSSEDQASTTGWHRNGSCTWNPDDGGYHEVCVTMADEFLESSAENDGNDLSSVAGHGERWCVCAWAWASAVERDPDGLEGLQLQCEESNAKLREVYQAFIDKGESMSGPTGRTYGVEQALEAVDRLCPSGDAAELGALSAKRARMKANAHATMGMPY